MSNRLGFMQMKEKKKKRAGKKLYNYTEATKAASIYYTTQNC